MRMTKHAGHYNGNEHALQLSIRSQFKANMLETDEKKIAAMKSEYAFSAFIIIYLIVIFWFIYCFYCAEPSAHCPTTLSTRPSCTLPYSFNPSSLTFFHHAAGSLTFTSLHFAGVVRSMVGTEAPKSIYEGDDDDEEEVDRTSFLQPKPPTGVPGTKPLSSFFILPPASTFADGDGDDGW